MQGLIESVTTKIKHFGFRLLIKKNEAVFNNEVRYLFIPKKSDSLMVIFSAFTGKKRHYNYVSTFFNVDINQLYILDSWGVEGSYYWLDYGNDFPEKNVNNLIAYICKHLDSYGIRYKETIEKFANHSEVGICFPLFVVKELERIDI